MKRPVTLILILGSCACCFVYGLAMERYRIFPYNLMKSVVMKVGLHTSRPDMRSRSQALTLLRANPYVASSVSLDPEERSILVNNVELASQGYNFYNSLGRNSAWLIDMDGNVLHKWEKPDLEGEWHGAQLLSDGNILVPIKDLGVAKLDKDSNLVWFFETQAHHLLWVTEEGDIYLLSREASLVEEIHSVNKTTVDKIVVLSPDGEKKDEISLLRLVQDSAYAYLLPKVSNLSFEKGTELDVLHTNYVEVFDGSKSDIWPLYKRGNILISMRTINSIAIVDGDSKQIVWLWGPNNLAEQHHPALLDNGNLLIFDNGWEESRVVELNPRTGTIEWSYSGDFFSAFAGSAQRLSNGNTLITVSSSGQVVEVTKDGEVVWEFVNPEVDEEGMRTNIYGMTRYSSSQVETLGLMAGQDRGE